MLVLVAAVVIARSVAIVLMHSVTYDEVYHFSAGLLHLEGKLGVAPPNDPPLGEALSVLPVYLAGYRAKLDGHVDPALGFERQYAASFFAQPVSGDFFRTLVAGWRGVIYVLTVAAVFTWINGLYGRLAAWGAAAVLTLEPNFAAHLHLITLDVLGVQMILVVCWLGWRYVQSPGWGRLLVLALASSVALLTKHTAIILPAVLAAYAGCWWVLKPRCAGASWHAVFSGWSTRWWQLLVYGILVFLGIWAFLGFEYHRPDIPEENNKLIRAVLDRPLPATTYITSFEQGRRHNILGHTSYLLGQYHNHGVWYYFLVMATYKTPLGLGLLFVLGLASLAWVRPKWNELALLIPALAWSYLLITTHINIGFRHFLPAYVFFILLSVRFLQVPRMAWRLAGRRRGAAAGGRRRLVVPQLHFLCQFPAAAHLRANRRLEHRLESSPQAGRPLADAESPARPHGRAGRLWAGVWSGSPVHPRSFTTVGDDLPTQGLLIISSSTMTVGCKPLERWAYLWKYQPRAVIGEAMLVYDLDHLEPRLR